MKKRIIHVVMAFVMLFAMAVPASANNAIPDKECVPFSINVDEEIERALNGETDLELDADISAAAWLEDKDGTPEDVEVFVTTREFSSARSVDDGIKRYATTVVARAKVKSEVNSRELDYVTGTVTLYWIDNPGIENELVSVSGSWNIATNPNTGAKATLSEKKVEIIGKFALGGQQVNFVNEVSDDDYDFEFDSPKVDIPGPGYTGYIATSNAKINGSKTLSVRVETSILS